MSERPISQAVDPDGGLPAASDLRARVEEALSQYSDCYRRVRSVQCRPSLYRSSFLIDDLDVVFEDGRTVALIAKPIAWAAMSPDAKSAKPAFLYSAERERATYEGLLAGLDVDAVRYFGSCVDDTGTRYLLLERADAVPLSQCGDFDAWRAAARWLVRLHRQGGTRDIEEHWVARHLVRYDAGFYECWIRRAIAFQRGSRAQVRELGRKYETVVDWLLTQPQGFIHGEFYSDNVLIGGGNGAPFVVRAVDWEMAAVGPAVIDLAALLAGNWRDDQRADLAETYYGACAGPSNGHPPRRDELKTLDYCLIHLAVRNLGWSATWTPPSRCAQDWLGEALTLCRKWDL